MITGRLSSVLSALAKVRGQQMSKVSPGRIKKIPATHPLSMSFIL